MSAPPVERDRSTEMLEYLRLASERAGIPVENPVLPQDRHLLAGDIRLHYLDWQHSGSGCPIVFLHGGYLSAHSWDVVCLGLHNRFHCLALDFRGHGDSEWSLDLDYADASHVRDVEALVDALGLDDFILVGSSLGGGIAMAYAVQHSAKLRGVGIVDVIVRPRPEAGRRVRRFALGPRELPSIDDAVKLMLEHEPRRDPELLRSSLLNELRALPDGGWAWKFDQRYQTLNAFRTGRERSKEQLEKELAAIECPALIAYGAESDAVHTEDAEALAASMPAAHARVHAIPGAGHAPEGDKPRELYELIGAFAESLGT
jgi:pimeloyl-ACP methyl ester carboxylesterase